MYIREMKLIEKYGIKTAKTTPVKTIGQAKQFIEKTGFPIVIKVDTDKPIHKTDVGGVKILENWRDLAQFEKNVKKIESSGVNVTGFVMQEVVSGVELFIGGKRDPQFGPVILFGLGGIFVEILDDVSVRLAPITKSDAKEMVKEIKGYPALSGARGLKPIKMTELINALVAVSDIITKNRNIKEIDINPLIANEKHVKAVDVRII